MKAWLLLLLSAVAVANDADELAAAFDSGQILIVADAQPACYRFDVYLAVSREQQRRGLMFVRRLPERSGMLFVYPRDGVYSMWMRNTFIPLDMLFVRADGSIANIIRDTKPHTDDSNSAVEPVRFVLELNAGVTERLGIGADSQLVIAL